MHDTQVFAPKRSAYCLVIGVLNEGERIRNQLVALQPYASLVDIVIADGGSSDGSTSPDFIRDKARALLVRKSGGGGLSSQHLMAFAFALDEGYDGIIAMDGNGKDGVDAIPRFVKALQDGCDMVQGSRFLPGAGHANTPIDRLLGIRYVFTPLMNLCSGCRYTDAINGFKGHSRRYLLDERLQPFRNIYRCYGLQYYLTCRPKRLGYRVTEVPSSRNYPPSGKTPTKINGLIGRLFILWELALALSGSYNP